MADRAHPGRAGRPAAGTVSASGLPAGGAGAGGLAKCVAGTPQWRWRPPAASRRPVLPAAATTRGNRPMASCCGPGPETTPVLAAGDSLVSCCRDGMGARSPGGAHFFRMVTLNRWVAWLPAPSVTFMVKTNLPAAVGVPASWLLLSLGAAVDTRRSPGGSCPAATDQV